MDRYENLIRQEKNLTLSRVIDISESLLPAEKRRAPWRFVNHGVDLLSVEDDLNAYMLAYGEMHEIKCRAAFQNFPFDKINTNVEIVDWGCGQGLASLVLMEMLSERNLDFLVKKITLIEPSLSALNRAKQNLCQRINGAAEIIGIGKCMPGYSNDAKNEVTDFKNTYTNTIHIFSNVLDIPTINLQKLSQIVSVGNGTTYVVCVGPQNQNAWRIDGFEGFFHIEKDNIFSNIAQVKYAYTQRTNHPITCKTKAFFFNNHTSVWDGENRYQDYDGKSIEAPIDDYSLPNLIFKDIFPQSLLSVYEKIHNMLNDGDRLFLRPNINGDTPDLVLYRPHIGIALFGINDEDIMTIDKQSPDVLCYHIEEYGRRLIKLHLDSLFEKAIENHSYWGLIKKVIVFTKCNRVEVDKIIKNIETSSDNKKQRYVTCLSIDNIENDLLHRIKMDYRNRNFSEELSNFFLNLISPLWHSYRDGSCDIKLSKKQIPLVISTEGAHQKIKGVAGSGKTQVMAYRAVNAMIRTGKPILILTFNITLRNYIKFRLNQIPADFSWNNVVILNYHEFFNMQALKVNKQVKNLLSYDDETFFDDYKVYRYSAIFIDEVQDFKEEWLRIIHNTFLDDDGEFVVFGDKSQNIFKRELGNDNEPKIPNVPGRWNESLDEPQRFVVGSIFNLSQHFRLKFMEYGKSFEQQLELDDQKIILYAFINDKKNGETFGKWCMEIIKRDGLYTGETVVLASKEGLLREIDYNYRQCSSKETKTTFASKEQFQDLANKDKEDLSRTKKLHFTMDSDHLKLSTIASFKGWEADNVILFIQDTEKKQSDQSFLEQSNALNPETIYTALTRARNRLYIFNLGNKMYDEFFKENISMA